LKKTIQFKLKDYSHLVHIKQILKNCTHGLKFFIVMACTSCK